MNINAISNRTIFRVLGIITAFVALIWIAFLLHRQLTWVVISLFFAVALNPAVEFIQRHTPGKNRGVAAGLVVFGSFFVGLLVVAAFVPSMVRQTASLISDVPHIIRDLGTSDSSIAKLLQHYHVVGLIQRNQAKIMQTLSGFGKPLLNILRSTLGSVIALLSVLSLTFFMITEGPGWLNVLRHSRYGEQFKAIEPVTTDMYAAVSGYVAGNLLTSALAAIVVAILLLIVGVPYAIPLGLMVGIFDLLPLIGATLGAIVVFIISLFHSLTAAIVVIVFFAIYQQLENHILQPVVYARTVQISPLIVFVAALMGASLGGIVGALIAIPVAASLKIIVEFYLQSTRPHPAAKK